MPGLNEGEKGYNTQYFVLKGMDMLSTVLAMIVLVSFLKGEIRELRTI